MTKAIVEWRKKGKVILACLLLISFALADGVDTAKVTKGPLSISSHMEDTYDRFPLYFIQNNGQVDKVVRFYERGGGHTTFFTGEGVYLNLYSVQRSAVINLTFIGANKNPEIIAEGHQNGRVNYFSGNDPAKWKMDIPTYQVIVYREIYPGIDMKFYGNNRQMEYDIIVKPGADPTEVRLSYEGIDGIKVTKEGDLEIDLTPLKSPLNKGGERGVTSAASRGGGKVFQKRPYIYQEIGGRRVKIEGRFKLDEVILSETKNLEAKQSPHPPLVKGGKGGFEIATHPSNARNDRKRRFIYGFEVASYDKRYPLIIDPSLIYSTYLGGNGIEYGFGIAVDPSGNAYVTGTTLSFDFPTRKPMQRASGGDYDAFVAKLDPRGRLIYSTYLGGMMNDYGYAIAVDSSGSAYVTGITLSINFPTANPLQPASGGDYDAFVAKLDPRGRLIYSTYLGGSGTDEGRGIAVDPFGNAYVTGQTYSTNFQTVNPLQSAFAGIYDAFVAKLNPAGSALVYSTYLGGSNQDYGYAVAVDSSGSAYVTGETRSANFPIENAFQPRFGGGGGYDAFVTRLDPKGAVIYSTYLGGRGHDNGYAITVDLTGNAYVTGRTSSTNFTKVNPMQPDLNGGDDAFIVKLDPRGRLIYSTYLGGSGIDEGRGIAVDPSGNAYVTGKTNSTNFPIARSLQRFSGGGFDAFVAKINLTGTSLVYSTYLGGSGFDQGLGIAVDPSGNVYVTGQTSSPNFVRTNPLKPTLDGTSDAFVVKIADAKSLKSSQP